jgi:dolichol-phosphate mannosyltransferase
MYYVLSIVVPTYNEKENILKILKALTALDQKYQIIVIDDDSPDGTAEIAEKFSSSRKNVRVFRRKERGLASAILFGIRRSSAPVFCVIDADLQHPPELIPRMLQKMKSEKADIIIASRFLDAKSAKGLSRFRRFLTDSSIALSKLFLKKARAVSDPMSGFFMCKKTALKGVAFRSLGFKFLLELIVKGRYSKISEVAYEFSKRKSGASKMGGSEYLRFGRLLVSLWLWQVAN